ncbi:hypothetical protein [Pseudoalteromonas denitrificans]|uniref:Fibronectin type III domain-containing protein n=1 Tax=Pseudoalteromonas denitrificans DSM 6059 TaxID=1123010 RepID=A0A1I1UZH3_9GAMM|nr:hypothetical protein [Pseudoalteromonas denitrificans]SFD76176.1 hypothetical protein SAMN02745724_05383 [Pseudoalteromonas denitrificans DSM 6059]
MFRNIILLVSWLFSSVVFADKVDWLEGVVGYIVEDELFDIDVPNALEINQKNSLTQLSWQSENVGFYRIQQAIDGGPWQLLHAKVNARSFIITSELNHRYRYRVAACTETIEESYCSSWSQASKVIGKLNTPTKIQVNAGIGLAKITFTQVDKLFLPTFYRLEYLDQVGNWILALVSNGSEFEFIPPESGHYQFRVFACVRQSNIQTCSNPLMSAIKVTLTPVPPIPEVKLNHGQYNIINLSWPEVVHANYYQYVVSDNERQIYNDNLTGLSQIFNDNLPRNNPLTFQVRACANSTHCSDYSSPKVTTPLPWGPPATPITMLEHGQYNKISFSWRELANVEQKVDYYNLLITRNDEPVFKKEKITGLSMVFNDSLPRANPLAFQVRACTNEGGCSFYSEKQMTTPLLWGPPQPPVTQLDHGKYNNISFSWRELANVEQRVGYYDVLVSKNGDTIFTKEKLTDLSLIFNDSLPRGQYLTFQVRACTNEGECSAYTEKKGSTPLPWPAPRTPILNLNHAKDNLITISWSNPVGEVQKVDYYDVLVNKNTQQIFLKDKITDLSFVFKDTLPRGYPLEFQTRACTNEGKCSSYSDKKITTPLLWEPLPEIINFYPEQNQVNTSQNITIQWMVKKVADFETSVNLILIDKDQNTQNLLSQVNASNYQISFDNPGIYTLVLEACNRQLDCGEQKTFQIAVIELGPVLNFISESNTVYQGEHILLSWDKPANTFGSLAYKLYVQKPDSAEKILLETIDNATQYQLTPNKAGKHIYFIKACIGFVCSELRNTKVTVIKLGPVLNFTSEKNSVNQGEHIFLSWDKPAATSGSLTYSLYVQKPNNAEKTLLETIDDATQYQTIPNIAGKHVYFIKACKGLVCSELRNTEVAVIMLGPVLNFTSEKNSVNQGDHIFLSWDKPAATSGSLTYNLYVQKPNNAEKTLLETIDDATQYQTIPNIAGKHVYFIKACIGSICSEPRSIVVDVNQTLVVTPTIIPDGGVVKVEQKVTLKTQTSGATLYFKMLPQPLDCNSKTDWKIYLSEVKLTQSTRLCVKASATNYKDSSVVIADFVVTDKPIIAINIQLLGVTKVKTK